MDGSSIGVACPSIDQTSGGRRSSAPLMEALFRITLDGVLKRTAALDPARDPTGDFTKQLKPLPI
jgi:hypothetical protein